MKLSYIEVLQNRIKIPIIQRDYAQGRQDGKTTKIRKDFLDVIFENLQSNIEGREKKLELDFIYGMNKGTIGNTSFAPIDGQQRLTTLWLLYWFVGVKEKVSPEEKTILAKFVYETRHSTTEFCRQLITTYQYQASDKSIDKDIQNQSWYINTWDFDPSIQAMLVMLKEIESRYGALGNDSLWKILINNNGPFYFYKLDMDNVGLSDDLYIKMNSRGKELTEFEYFKVGFSELIEDANLKRRFDKCIDQKWSDAIWNVVKESPQSENSKDIALLVDNCFLNLFNFVTYTIAHKKGILYQDTIKSKDQLDTIYDNVESQEFLFDMLDAISGMKEKQPDFWTDTFYCEKEQFDSDKTRLFFIHKNTNLLNRCLFQYHIGNGLSFPEQLLLYAVLLHIKEETSNFKTHFRIIRNLVVNSDDELREKTFGENIKSVENIILRDDLSEINNFKTDQVKEEREKQSYLEANPDNKEILYRLEDSDVLRACTSIIELNENFPERAIKFLELFDEDEFKDDSNDQTSLLLCFGDYSQAYRNGILYNFIGKGLTRKRDFLTTPGFGKKKEIFSKTRPVLMDCLDFFIENNNVNIQEKIATTLEAYENHPKDWKYYLLKYKEVREKSIYGYFKRYDEKYDNLFCIMSKQETSGQHWDMYLYCVNKQIESEQVTLGNYHHNKLHNYLEGYLRVEAMDSSIMISSQHNGYLFENENENEEEKEGEKPNTLLQHMIDNKIINEEAQLIISQDDAGYDQDDRIEILKDTLLAIIDI